MTLSIITVTYNASATLQRTLDSVAAQTAPELIEHIIIDGASTDGTLDIIDDYRQHNGERYPIIVKSEPDRGLYDAMNKAIDMAHGDYLCFLNAGDKFHAPSTLADTFGSDSPLINISQDKSAVGVIYGDTNIVDNDGRYLRPRHLLPPEHLTSKSFKRGMLVCHQSFYARRTLCPHYNLSYRFSADVDWCIRVLKAGEIAGMTNYYTHSVLTDYLDEGMTTRNHRASLIERFNVMRHHYGLLSTIWNHVTFIFR